MSKRGYSRDFPKSAKPKRYLLDDIPPQLWETVQRKAQQRGYSMRGLILFLLKRWGNRQPDLDDSALPAGGRRGRAGTD